MIKSAKDKVFTQFDKWDGWGKVLILGMYLCSTVSLTAQHALHLAQGLPDVLEGGQAPLLLPDTIHNFYQ